MDLSEDILANLTQEDKQELEIWTELLESRGFELLRRFLQGNYDSNEQVIANAPTWDSYVYARGSRDALSLVLNLKEILEHRLTTAAEEQAEITEDDTYDEISVNLGLE